MMENLPRTHEIIGKQVSSAGIVENILHSIRIPPCPEVLLALVEEMRQAEVDFTRLTRLISKDVGLAASMLKTANSPYFAAPNKICTIPHAVSVLGMKNLIQVVRGSALQKALAGDKMAMQQFWERSSLTAVLAARMADKLYDISHEEAYTVGLFHDCGIPVLMQKFPDYPMKLTASDPSFEPSITFEDSYYGTNHAVVGNLLARNWHLPEQISQAILVHHDYTIYSQPDHRCTPQICALVAITQMAEHIAATLLGKPDDAEWQAYGRIALDHLGLCSEDMDSIAEDALAEL